MATIDNRFPTEGTQIDIEARLAAIETALASLMADTTGQSIASAISGLGTALGSDKANISGDNIASPSTFRENIEAQGQFTFYGDTTGTTELALPSSWHAILIQTVYSYYNITSVYTYGMVSNNYTNISLGNYGTSYAVGRLRRDKVQLSTMNWGGTDVTANAKLYIYVN